MLTCGCYARRGDAMEGPGCGPTGAGSALISALVRLVIKSSFAYPGPPLTAVPRLPGRGHVERIWHVVEHQS